MNFLRLRFSLRTMFVAITAIGIGLGLFAVPLYHGRVDRQAAEAILLAGGTVVQESTLSPPLEWLAACLPSDYHVRSTHVEWIGKSRPDFVSQAQLRHITSIVICGADIKAGDWRHIAKLEELRELRIVHSQIETGGMDALLSCTELESLDLSDVDGGDMQFLAQMPRLSSLVLTSTDCGDIELCELPHLKFLALGGFDSISVRRLPQLTQMETRSIRISAHDLYEVTRLHVEGEEVELADHPLLSRLFLTGTRRLTIRNTPSLNSVSVASNAEGFFETGLDELATLPALEEFGVTAGLEDRDLKKFLKFPALKAIHFGKSHVTRVGLADLAKYPHPLELRKTW